VFTIRHIMKVLVTGATGRVGRTLIPQLLECGHTLRCLAISREDAEALEPYKVEVVVGDLDDFQRVLEAVSGVEVIYHLGALLPAASKDPFTLYRVNVTGTFHVLEASARQPVGSIRRFIFASTDAVYPVRVPAYLPVDENHPRGANIFYGATKVLGEELCFAYHRQYHIPVVCCRFAFVIGVGEILRKDYFWFFLSRMLGMFRAQKGSSPEIDRSVEILEKLWDGEDRLLVPRDAQGVPYRAHPVDIRDLVQGLLLAAERDSAIGECINLAGPAAFSLDEAIRYASERTGIPWVEARLPAPPLNYEISIAKARSLLGYEPEYDVFRMIDAAVAAEPSG
jgi:UDP-glucose 4-epimerase